MWSMVARYTTLGEAEAARSALDAAGIDTEFRDAHFIGVSWISANAVGWIKLLVPHDAHEDAMEVLTCEAMPEGEPEPLPDAPAERAEAPRFLLFFALSVIAIGVAVAIERTEAVLGAVAVLALIVFLPRERPPIAPPPSLREAADIHCPRCGSRELHRIHYRKLAAIPLFMSLTAPLVALLWLFSPRWQCDTCGGSSSADVLLSSSPRIRM